MVKVIKNWFENNKVDRKGILLLVWSLLTFSLYPFVFVYTQNVGQSDLVEVVLPALKIFGLTAIICTICCAVFQVNVYRSALFSMVFMLWYMNYIHIERMFTRQISNLKFWHIIPICLVILFGILLGLHYLGKNHLIYLRLCGIVGGVFLLLSVFNLIVATPSIISKLSHFKQSGASIGDELEIKVMNNDISNFYIIIPDEYARTDMLYKYIGYDNSEFEAKLKDLGFNVSDSSYSTAPFTQYSVSNTVYYDLEFVPDVTPEGEYRSKMSVGDLPLLSLVKSYGFSTFATSAISYITKSPLTDSYILSNSVDFVGLETTALTYSLPKRLTVPGEKLYNQTLNILNNFHRYTNLDTEHVFALYHIHPPHSPFVLDLEGNLPPASVQDNWDDRTNYLNQFIYVTDWLEKTATELVTQDPNCVILIFSDHGVRPYAESQAEKYYVFNALYYQGKELSIEGLSTIDTLRLVLNEMFDMDLSFVMTSLEV